MNDCDNNDPSCLRSESGVFSLDKDGVARHFFEVHGKCSMVDNSQIIKMERLYRGMRDEDTPVWRSFADLREEMCKTLSEFAVCWSASVLDLLLNEIWLNNTRHLTNDYADWMREVSDLNLDTHVRTAFENVDAESRNENHVEDNDQGCQQQGEKQGEMVMFGEVQRIAADKER